MTMRWLERWDPCGMCKCDHGSPIRLSSEYERCHIVISGKRCGGCQAITGSFKCELLELDSDDDVDRGAVRRYDYAVAGAVCNILLIGACGMCKLYVIMEILSDYRVSVESYT